MESLGEVGVLMSMGGENSRGEILKSLLSASKAHKPEELETSVLQDLQKRNPSEESLVLQIQVPERIIQHIPITYLTAENSNLTPVTNGTLIEPVTYVLSRSVLGEEKHCSGAGSEPQKIILVQEPQPVYSSSSGGSSSAEGKVFEVKGEEEGWDADRRAEESGVVPEGKREVLVVKGAEEKEGEEQVGGVRGNGGGKPKEKNPGSNTKVQKKVSPSKKLMGRRKNSKLKTNSKGSGKDGAAKGSNAPEERKEGEGGGGEEKKRQNLFELIKLEDNVDQVAERLKIGCECSDWNCFDGLKPDDVFKHRLNIADLTKAEHDMYLMGVIMASIHNLEETCRHKERIRIRSCYAYQGKKVCLTAFLYLQHVTLYQMKRLRSHLKNHGVSPRIHGNRGRKPANTLSLDIYRRATTFVQTYIENNCVKTVPGVGAGFSSSKGGSNPTARTADSKPKKEPNARLSNKMTSYHLPAECTKRRVHKEYKTYCENLKLCQKVMKYSTFTSFLKKQFPNVKFHKREEKKQERTGGKGEEGEKGKQKEERTRVEDEGAEKSVQVDKGLAYIPAKTQIAVEGEGVGGRAEPAFGGSQPFDVRQTQATEQYYVITESV